jgi:hypothetical protein
VKARGLLKSAVDQPTRHVVSGQHEKAHRGQRLADLLSAQFKGSGLTGKVIPDIDDGDALRHCDHVPQHVTLTFKRIGEGRNKGAGS